ncbi:MAG: hypothetical protein LBK83_11185 [Treponema sp.]|jgi:hypothetical protein|nr:hypothetical protein [Treponema sp.]
MTEKQMRALEEKFARGESIDMPFGRGKRIVSRHLFVDEYGNWFYDDYIRIGVAVITRTGLCATGETIEEALKNVIPIQRKNNAYQKAFVAWLDAGRHGDCPDFATFDTAMSKGGEAAVLTHADDEPSESFGGPLEGPAGHDGGGE